MSGPWHPTRRGVLALSLVAAATASLAQDIRVNAAFDRRRVLPGEMVSYTITLSAESLPGTRSFPRLDFEDFDLAAGPSSGQSSEVRFVNGAVSRRENLTLTWRLVPRTEGIAAVPAFTFTMGGQTIEVPRAEIQVVAPGGASPGASQPGSQAQPRSPAQAQREQRERARADGRRPWSQPASQPGEGLSVRTEVEDTQPWLGQAIVVRDVLTFDTNVSSFREREAVEFPGFSKKRNDKLKTEGRRVQDPDTREIRSEATLAEWVVVPLTPGRQQLPGHGYKFSIPSDDPMERMFRREHEVIRESPPVVIDVRPLPDGAPPSFRGAVGSFQVDARLASKTLRAGDGTQLVVTIRGRGSFDGIEAPELDLPPEIKAFAPEVTERSEFGADGQIEGSKTFTIPLLVTEPGEHEIPALAWAFFDPRTGRHVERRTPALQIVAAPGEAPIVGSMPVQATADVQVQGTDIRHLRADLAPWQPDLAASGIPRWLLLAAALGPILNLAVAGVALAARVRRRDPAERRAREAPAAARKRIATAAAALAQRRPVEAIDGAARAITGLLSARLGLGAELAPAEASRAVASGGDADLARRVERFLSDCDFARFASAGAVDAQRLLEEARALVPLLAGLEAAPPREGADPSGPAA